MATISMTVTNRVNVFGIAPSDKWGSYNWNAFLWGEGTADLVTETTKVIGNSVAGTTALSKEPMHVFGSTLTLGSETVSEQVLDANGYHQVFPDRTTDAESRDTPTWASAAASARTWTSAAVGATTWS